METTISLTSARIGIPYANRPTSRCFQPKHKRFAVVSVSTPSTSTNGLKIEATTSYTAATTTTTTSTVYKDNWLEQVVINYLSKAVQDTIGIRNEKSGYESLVVAAGSVFRSFDLIQQRQLVVKALQSAVPGPVSFMIKKLMPPSKFSREYFAFSTTVFFPWLVGPCEYPHELPRGKEVRFLKKGIMLKHELASSSFYSTYWLMDTFPTNPDITRPHGLCVRESEFEGRKERNVVYIKKCRFLESSNCAGMCTNLCKVPTQEFINSSFGIPVNMVPNFDDMSCEMVFGQNPPMLQDDPAFKQPCYKLCDVKQKHDAICITNPLESMKQ